MAALCSVCFNPAASTSVHKEECGAASSLYEQVTVLEYTDTVSQCSSAVTPAVDLNVFLMCCTDEFEAHSSSVSCSALGKSSGRLLATGGEDCRVNLWAVSKANCIMVRQLIVT